MKKLFIAFASLMLLNSAQSQLTQGNWLVGGSASFASTQSSHDYPNSQTKSEEINLSLSPNLGYFLADKFAFGVSPSFSWGKGEFNTGVTTNTKRFLIGPFTRYYLLNTENPFNILANASYQYGIYSSEGIKGNINMWSVGAGPVIFFNSSVALEFTIGYSSRIEAINEFRKTTQKGFQTGIGFQIHLEK